MKEVTSSELWARRDSLENEAASMLGHMLIEFSRLDVNLGLCLCWVDGGSRIESQTKSVEALNLKAKLDELAQHVAVKLPTGSKRRRAYANWIDRANSVRQQRNNLVHGRWGIDAYNNKVVNVIGLPTSGAQKSIEYTTEELAEVVQELRKLQQELARLRELWPV